MLEQFLANGSPRDWGSSTRDLHGNSDSGNCRSSRGSMATATCRCTIRPTRGSGIGLNLRAHKKRGKVDTKRIRRLEELGFSWSLRNRSVSRYDWGTMVAQLEEFKRQQGHCRVPRNELACRRLYVWLRTVRKRRRLGTLSAEQITQLERLGLAWQPQEDRWQKNYAALVKYQRKYGHCRVPDKWPPNQTLARWVQRLRKFKHEGRLSGDWIERLDRIGFSWSSRPRWEHCYAELVEYKKAHGDCNVSTLSKTHKSLANRVRRLRAKRKRGELSPEQIQDLDAIGFAWCLQSRPRSATDRSHPRTETDRAQERLR